MDNLYQIFKSLLPQTPLLAGTVVAVFQTGCSVELPDGSVISARGSASIGAKVFVRNGLIEGEAPNLSVVEVTL
ncbi:MAG: hypothetical protein K2Y28_08465 [Burkholderiaceae bacterium]|nr:hypothetical protein [Burkholderiaceae bacterium]